jgi:vacuolar-type H+-ATPase subunit I/STV1
MSEWVLERGPRSEQLKFMRNSIEEIEKILNKNCKNDYEAMSVLTTYLMNMIEHYEEISLIDNLVKALNKVKQDLIKKDMM